MTSSYTFDYKPYLPQLVLLLQKFEKLDWSKKQYFKIIKSQTKPDGSLFSKHDIILAYRELAGTNGLKPFNPEVVQRLQMKPTRTISGVAPITVLTKPFPCPGKCIFCPNDVRMPKSYLSDEPGAQRAERNFFDPYLQTYNRLQALHNIGHQVSKAEIIVLGGTWSFYSEAYQIWFIKECFRAMNEFGAGIKGEIRKDDRARIEKLYEEMNERYRTAQEYGMSHDPKINKEALLKHELEGADVGVTKTYNRVVSELYVAPERKAGFDAYQTATWEELEHEQKINELAAVRSVGLVVETRPDNISVAEVRRIRRLGCTKTQIGVQSLQDSVLDKNKRGHGVAATRRAFGLLRQAGFKIHAHWMANLHGSSVELDKKDYDLLFEDPDFKPDELKVYPCSLIGSAELMQYYKDGRWKPYTHEELLEVVTHALKVTPEYCRLTRVIRDIPSTDIVDGNKLTNFRQIAQDELRRQEFLARDIRAREIRDEEIDPEDLEFVVHKYQTSVSIELFLQYVVQDKSKNKNVDEKNKEIAVEKPSRLVGFLRLSLPRPQAAAKPVIDELAGAAIIREVHVYGPTVKVGVTDQGKSQHLGIGTALLKQARNIVEKMNESQDQKKTGAGISSKNLKYKKIAVISAIGTKEYYRSRGFIDGELYQFLVL
jgi:elongator complex protein 3